MKRLFITMLLACAAVVAFAQNSLLRQRMEADGGLLRGGKDPVPPPDAHPGPHPVGTPGQPPEHGFGLPAVQRILQQLKGELVIDYSEPWFQVVAEIPND